MKNTYTIQFDYNNVTHTYIDQTFHKYKPSMHLEDIALMLVGDIIERENLYVEGEIAHKIRLLGKDQEILWASEN